MQPGADVLGGVRVATALVACDQHPTRHDAGDTGQPNPLPDAAHSKSVPKLRGEREHGVAGAGAGRDPDRGYLAVSRLVRPDRAIQSMTNSPVNHVGMTVAIEDLPPLIWHAELGDKLTDMWTGTNHRGVQLNDARQAVERWIHNYGQRCWLRQLTPYANREQEDRAFKVVARMDGTPFPSTARLTGRWFRGRFPSQCRLDPRNSVPGQQGS